MTMTSRHRQPIQQSTIDNGNLLATFTLHTGALSDKIWNDAFEPDEERETTRGDYLFAIGMGMLEAELKKLSHDTNSSDTEFVDTLDSLQSFAEWLDRWANYFDDEKYKSLVESINELKAECHDASVELTTRWLAFSNRSAESVL